MKFELEEYHRGITDEELIADLKRVANEFNKKSVSFLRYNERGRYNSSTLARRFGSWSEVLKRAGLQMNRHPVDISEEELFQNIEEIWIKLGRQPRSTEIKKPLSKYALNTYANRFGTWGKALKKFVAYINNEESISSDAPSISVSVPQSNPKPDFVANIVEDPYKGEAMKKLETEPSTQRKTKRNINWRLRFVIMKRDNFKCQKCGRSPATDPSIILHVDHKIAWANGGETTLENLQTLCSKCNVGKSNLE